MICDRCSTIYKTDFKEKENRNVRLVDYEDSEYDLCTKCQKSLEKWFDDPQETVSKHKIDEVIEDMKKKAQVNDMEWEQYSDYQNYYVLAVNEFVGLLREACDENE